MSSSQPSEIAKTHQFRTGLYEQLAQVSQSCTQCQLCVQECAFLQHHGNPKRLADNCTPDTCSLAFECHLCELCTAVCPHSLNPAKMFLEMRREAFERGQADFPEHKGLRNYERTGTSKRFSFYSLPQGCDTIFFPGCALSGSRAQTTHKTYRHLQQHVPTIGIVLDCCSKPSHDLGDSAQFNSRFDEIKTYLQDQGVKTVLVACPNCQRIFTEYAHEFSTLTVYEWLDGYPLPDSPQGEGEMAIHDPCVSRFYNRTQDSVRSLIRKKGFKIFEPLHTKHQTLCCGEGAGVKSLTPHRSRLWSDKRQEETSGKSMVSYCAACATALSGQTQCLHILDLLFDADSALNGKAAAKAPVTYFNRLKLKHRLCRQVSEGTIIHERAEHPDSNRKRQLLFKLALFACLTLAAIGL